jgi:RNA-directed DNA polymerase
MTTEHRIPTATKLQRISWLSASDHKKRFTSLMHLFNEESLAVCFNELDGKKAVGTDGVSKEEYGKNLGENLKDLVRRMRAMSYRPGPVREVLIPKEGRADTFRPLGISNFEDKLIQAMTHKILESIYEPIFLPCSYGFRPGRGCHDAIRGLHNNLFSQRVGFVIDVDLANYFGTIDRQILTSFLRQKIGDEKFIRYIIRMFKAGVLANDELMMTEEGVVQGSICSPILANIMAHHVIDEWFQTTVKTHCIGRTEIFRFADDMVISCECGQDAQRIRVALTRRLNKYGLAINESKTKVITFSQSSYKRGIRQGTFEFLGFCFYMGRSQKGWPIPKIKTSPKRFRTKLKKVKDWIRRHKDGYTLAILWKALCRKLSGHMAYYGVSFNTPSIKDFFHETKKIIFKWLNRRSQRKSMTWDKFNQFMEKFPLPKVRIVHNLFIVNDNNSSRMVPS